MDTNLDPLSDTAELACNYMAIQPEARSSHTTTATSLFASVQKITELPDGYAFQLPPERATLFHAIEFIENERRCCPFFTFTLIVGGSVWLNLSGGAGVKAFIASNIVESLQATGQLSNPTEWLATHASSTVA